jgi:hypothetical protein
MAMSILAVKLLYVLAPILYYLTPVQSLHSAEYYKCLTAKVKSIFPMSHALLSLRNQQVNNSEKRLSMSISKQNGRKKLTEKRQGQARS